MQRPAHDPLPETASLLLDVMRFGLCLLVLAGHMSQGWFNSNWPNMMGFANGAVPAFFVLSGFVIRYVTRTRERDGWRYFASRASRIYSVVLPAIVLTVVLDSITRHTNPAFYRGVFLPTPWAGVPLRIAINLLFLRESWGHAVLLLSNVPMWSLGYEVPYYILFGIVSFIRGPVRIVSLVLFALLLGPQVIFLLPIWCSGLWLYDLWQWFRSDRAGLVHRALVIATAVIVLLLLWLPLSDGHFGGAYVRGFDRVGAAPNPLLLLHQYPVRATMLQYSSGLLSFAGMFLALCASDLLRLPKQTRAARVVRFIAESTFTLYLFHFPMLMLAAGLHLYRTDSTVGKLLVMLLIVGFCIAVSIPIERFKRWLRQQLSAFPKARHTTA